MVMKISMKQSVRGVNCAKHRIMMMAMTMCDDDAYHDNNGYNNADYDDHDDDYDNLNVTLYTTCGASCAKCRMYRDGAEIVHTCATTMIDVQC